MRNTILFDVNTTIEKIAHVLEASDFGLLGVVDSNGIFCGVISQELLKKCVLEKEDIWSVLYNESDTAYFKAKKSELEEKLLTNNKFYIPLVDKNYKFRGFYLSEKCCQNYVVIMAGGRGSRMEELSDNFPKSMLSIGRLPMLQHLILSLKYQGFYHFVFCLNYKSEIIKDYFGDGSNFGIAITYVIEQKKLGTAGALSLIPKKCSLPLLVINADILTSLNFRKLLSTHISSQVKATMCICDHNLDIPYGLVDYDNNMKFLRIKEKPVMTVNINAGIYVLESSALNYVPKNNYFDMPDLFDYLTKHQQQVAVYKIPNYWLDIGNKKALRKANNDLSLISRV